MDGEMETDGASPQQAAVSLRAQVDRLRLAGFRLLAENNCVEVVAWARALELQIPP